MNIAITLLQILVAFLVLASIAGGVVVALELWQMRRAKRLPPPPLSNDDRIRLYQQNERAYRWLR